MKDRSWWWYRTIELIVAFLVVVAVTTVVDKWRQAQRNAVAAENWFTVNQIFVPDHEPGTNPDVTYDRTVKQAFQGFWVAEVQRLGEEGRFVLECTGSGVSDYEPEDYIPRNTVTFEWFIGERCERIPDGVYRIRVSWKMKRDGWPEKQVVAYSNMFHVGIEPPQL